MRYILSRRTGLRACPLSYARMRNPISGEPLELVTGMSEVIPLVKAL